MKNLVGKKLNKTTKFVGEEITITKLPLARVFDIQEKAKAAGADEKAQMEIMLFTFQSAVTGAGPQHHQLYRCGCRPVRGSATGVESGAVFQPARQSLGDVSKAQR